MRPLRPILALLLAVFWLPVTMHCQLERLVNHSALSCCSHGEDQGQATHHHDEDCHGDGCAEVESGFYRLAEPDAFAGVWTPSLAHADPWVMPVADATAHPVLDFKTDTPSLIAVTWHFCQRTAPSPRAPTLIA